jgi:hypothetical protein
MLQRMEVWVLSSQANLHTLMLLWRCCSSPPAADNFLQPCCSLVLRQFGLLTRCLHTCCFATPLRQELGNNLLSLLLSQGLPSAS